MGPMINKQQVEHIDDLVKSAVAEGGKVLCGGKPTTIDGKGFFYEPTVISNCKHEMRIMKEEIFGPVLPITTFKTLDEAIEKANDCQFGLTILHLHPGYGCDDARPQRNPLRRNLREP